MDLGQKTREAFNGRFGLYFVCLKLFIRCFWVSDPNYKSPALGSFYSLVLGTSLF